MQHEALHHGLSYLRRLAVSRNSKGPATMFGTDFLYPWIHERSSDARTSEKPVPACWRGKSWVETGASLITSLIFRFRYSQDVDRSLRICKGYQKTFLRLLLLAPPNMSCQYKGSSETNKAAGTQPCYVKTHGKEASLRNLKRL